MSLPSVKQAAFGVAFGLLAIWLANNVDAIEELVG